MQESTFISYKLCTLSYMSSVSSRAPPSFRATVEGGGARLISVRMHVGEVEVEYRGGACRSRCFSQLSSVC